MKRKFNEKKKIHRSVIEPKKAKITTCDNSKTVLIWNGEWKEVPVCH
jgi:hypothetical protein